MPISYFTDKTHCPDENEIAMILGEALPLWQRLTTFIDQNYIMVGDMIYGGAQYGWNVWYRESGNTLVSIYPQAHEYVAQVVLNRKQVEKALQLSLGDYIGRTLSGTPSLQDECRLFLKIRNVADVWDVEKLLLIKKRPSRNPEK